MGVMRLIGHMAEESEARTFGNYLYVQGIENHIEDQRPEGWAVWIVDEDRIEQGAGLLKAFLQNPSDSKYSAQARAATELRAQAEKKEQQYRKKILDRQQFMAPMRAYGFGPVTLALMVISVVVFCLSRFGGDLPAVGVLFISDQLGGSLLPEVRHGQIWRLVTPIFIHMNFLHIFFNVWWLKDLGGMIEDRQGSWYLGILVVVIAVVSNFTQYYFQGPIFGGLSGVVYGLLGYIWLKGRFDPVSGLFLHPTTVTMMMVWFVLCWTGILGPVANLVHAAGLGVGCAWGYLSSQRRWG